MSSATHGSLPAPPWTEISLASFLSPLSKTIFKCLTPSRASSQSYSHRTDRKVHASSRLSCLYITSNSRDLQPPWKILNALCRIAKPKKYNFLSRLRDPVLFQTPKSGSRHEASWLPYPLKNKSYSLILLFSKNIEKELSGESGIFLYILSYLLSWSSWLSLALLTDSSLLSRGTWKHHQPSVRLT